MKVILRAIPVLMLLILTSCGDLLIGQRRDPSFYRPVISEKSAPKKVAMESEKLVYSDKYPMRMALFSNEKFYYEIDELGEGWGTWTMDDGVVKLYAPRPFFDMRIVMSGDAETGEARIFKFRDRTGIQTVALSVRDPEAAKAEGKTLPPLRKFTRSKDGF
jgi:hypothetical protein